jgi:hypothetical protein
MAAMVQRSDLTCHFTQSCFPHFNAELWMIDPFSPLYPALYPGANFQSQKQPTAEKGEMNKTLVNIARIIDCIP